MNKKGFTLAELLAVVAILAIIILVAVPTFNKYVFNSKEEYYKTLESSVRTAGMEYMSENSMFLPQQIGYYSTVSKETLFASGIIEKVTDSEGNECERVDVVVKKNKDNNYSYETCLKCGNYKSDTAICNETYDEWASTDIDSSNDKTGPSVTDIYVSNKTTNSVTINAVCVDEESGIKEYLYSIDGGKTYVSGGKNSSYKFDNLVDNQRYSFKVKCISDNSLNSERESGGITALTARFTNPTIKQVQTSDGFPKAGFAYSPKRDIQTTYNSHNIETEDVKYFIRSTINVQTNVDVYECSGDLNNLNQNSCSGVPTRSMQANKWYQTSNLKTTTTFATNTNNGNHILYACIGDGKNLSSISNYIVTNIDVTKPNIYSHSNPRTLGKEAYNFLSNVGYSFGFSSGKVTCDPPSSYGTGSYYVTCTATGNNGLKASTTFLVKHSYPPTWVKVSCNPYPCGCNCYESCGWCVNGAWDCCAPPCWGCCTQGTYCTLACSTCTCYSTCDSPTCPQGGSYSNGMCEY